MGLFDIFRKKPVDGTYHRESGAADGESFGYGQDGAYGDPDLFRMAVEDVFSITGRGTVVTGQIQSGCVSTGDSVTLRRTDGSVREVTVCGIEMFRKMLDRAGKGDNVGLLLRGVTKSDVGRGDVLER